MRHDNPHILKSSPASGFLVSDTGRDARCYSGSRRLDSRESSGGDDDDNPTHPLPPLPLLSRSMSIDASKPFFDQVTHPAPVGTLACPKLKHIFHPLTPRPPAHPLETLSKVNAAVVKSELMSRPTMDAQDASGLLRRWLLRDLPRKYFGSYRKRHALTPSRRRRLS